MFEHIKKFREIISYTLLVASFTLGAPAYFLTQSAYAKDKEESNKAINILDKKLQLSEVKWRLEKLHSIPEEQRPDWVIRDIEEQEEIKKLLIKSIHGS